MTERDAPDPAGRAPVPIVLTIAGSDSGGGAGIQADLKTFAALGTYGASVITAVTAQDTRTVSAVHEIPADVVTAQLVAVLDDLDVAAIKIGMLASVPIIEAVADVLARHADLPIVLDPVMVAKGGDRLLRPDAHAALVTRLCPLARVLTPNVPEAAILLGEPEAHDAKTLDEQARRLSARCGTAVLLKGGHLRDGDSGDGLSADDDPADPPSGARDRAAGRVVDVLLADGGLHRHAHARLDTVNTHGTGCTLSSAIAASLAHGTALPAAVAAAIDYVHDAIARADELRVGHGHGPVHHFHRWWPTGP